MTKRSDFLLREILKIYKQGDGGQAYIERHPVKTHKDGERYIGEGRPLTMKTLKGLINYISVEEKGYKPMLNNALMNPRILSIEPNLNHKHIIWYSPAGPRTMEFTKGARIPSGTYNMPAMLYVVKYGGLTLYSMTTGKSRPKLSTKLYYAPLLNVYGDKGLCWGSVDVNNMSPHVDIEINQWMDAVWETTFSHTGSEPTTKTDILKVYKRITNKPFPKNEMMDTKQTLADVLKAVTI